MTFFQRIKTPFAEAPADDRAQLLPRTRLVGELLQERREDLGLDLDEIGAMLRIKPAYLAALEQGRSQDLPGPAYAIGFVRAYADFLGLESDQVLAHFKAEVAGVNARPDLALPVPLGERSLPGAALVLVALILALCGYGIWFYLSTEERDRPERVAAVPAALEVPQPAPAPAAANVPGSGQSQLPASPSPAGPAGSPPLTQAAPPPTSAAVPPPAPSPPAAAASPVISPPAAHPAAAAVPTVAPPAASQQTAPKMASISPSAAATSASGGKVSIRALVDCWIQVRAADQSIVFSRVLKSGEVYSVPVRAGLSLRTGNAGALEIAVDGKAVPSIGGIGAMRRDVALDPTELAAGTAVHG